MAHVAFLQFHRVPWNGVASLSAWLTQHGHHCTVHCVKPGEAPPPADLYGLALLAVHSGDWRRYAPTLTATGVPIVIGGVLATVSPESIEPRPEWMIRGEGEIPLLALLEGLGGAPVCDGLYRNGVPTAGAIAERLPIERLPRPDHSLHRNAFAEVANGRVGHFLFSRGCAFRCSFCYAPAWDALHDGRAVRMRGAEEAVDEMSEVLSRYPFDDARIYDDNFGSDVRWLRLFARLYRERVGRPFACYLRADLLDEQRIRLLAEAGCVEVGVGVETWSERLRAQVLKKRIPNDRIIKAGEALRRYGVALTVFLIFGLPEETPTDAAENVRMLSELRPDFVWTSRLQVYPGTPMEDQVRELGLFRWKEDDYSRSDNPREAELFRVETLMPLAQALRLPADAVRYLARLPATPVWKRLSAPARKRSHARSLICRG